MSDQTQPPSVRGNAGCLTALLIVIGVVLLLPGICAIILIGLDFNEVLRDPNWALLLVALLAVGAGGVALIWWAIKRPRP
jgi:drug/metabolite transporter (DMT)-like permease